MKTSKRIISLILILVLIMAMGCGSTDEKVQNESSNTENENGVKEDTENEIAEKLKYVHVEVVHGTNWWNAAYEGMKEQAEFYGDVDVEMVGPVNRDAAEQIQLVEDQITKGVDMISIVPVDNTALDPVLKKARDAGIVVVVQESQSVVNCDANVEMQDDTGVGKEYIESLVQAKGDKGGYVIFLHDLTAASHMTRAESIINYQKENYPDLYLLTDPITESDNLDTTYANVCSLLQTYDDLIGICLIGDSGNIAVANALRDKGRTDIANIGMAMPSVVKDIVKEGLMEPYTNFSPYDNGKTLLSVAHWLALGNSIEDMEPIPNAGETGEAAVDIRDGKNVYVNARYTITPENVDNFDF